MKINIRLEFFEYYKIVIIMIIIINKFMIKMIIIINYVINYHNYFLNAIILLQVK